MKAIFPPIILASTSRYRRELLARLARPFSVEAPGVDESAQPGEAPAQRARRLAYAKAEAVSRRHPEALVIGSDQVCAVGERILDKAGSRGGQIEQLQALSGRSADFHTALCMRMADHSFTYEHLDLTRCVFRQLSPRDIESYADREAALDCAGGFKVEGLGISLLERVESLDPTALVGLPLIALGSGIARYEAEAAARAPAR